MDFCNIRSHSVESGGVTYSNFFVVVCRLTAYVMAVPFSKTITAPQLVELYLERVVGVMRLPHEVFSDHDHIITKEFFTTLCELSRVQQKQSPVYRPRSKGRAERVVGGVVDSLLKCFGKTGRKNWVQLLPLPLWTANDIPGPVSGYSPHFLVFGRQPIGFGDCSPVIPEHESQDAIQFFQRLVADGKYVQQTLQDIHDRESRKFWQQHPRHVYQDGERVWYQNHKKNSNKRKLDRLWQGPGEVLGRVRINQYLAAARKGEVVLDYMRIKPYIPPLIR